MAKNFQEMMQIAREKGPKIISVACAQDAEVLSAINQAHNAGIADIILVGDRGEIVEIANEIDIDPAQFKIIDIKDSIEASRKAVELVSTGKAHMVMKGLVDTSTVLKAVLDAEIARTVTY